MDQVKIDVIKKSIEEKKGEDIQVIFTEGKNPFYDAVVIATVNNYRQANSIADEIEKNLALIKEEVHHVEGNKTPSEWVLVDCSDVIVHLFTASERERISLETLLTGKKKTQ